jgi:ribosomal-protein-alanine N-acetyltransferase
MIKLHTDRLIIRDHVEADLLPLHSLLSDKDTMYFLEDLICNTLEESHQNLTVSMAEATLGPKRTKFFFAIVLKDTGSYIGEIGFTVLHDCPEGKVVEMGYFSLPQYWGKGIITEAASRVIQYAFEEAGVIKVEIGCNKANVASEKVIQKLGLTKEADRKKHSLLDGKLWDRVEYGVLCTTQYVKNKSKAGI